MRIALVCERFEPGRGGVEQVVYELSRELARRGRDVTVICRRATSDPPTGVRCEELRGPSFWQPLRIGSFSRRASARVSSFDVVHGFSRTRHQHIYRAGGGSHAAYLERVHRWPALERALSPRHRAILRIEEAVFRDPEQIVQCNSKLVANELAGRYRIPQGRLVTIHNGVDTERFHPERRTEREEIRAELGVKGAVALFAGSGFRRKGLDRALDALAEAGAPVTLLVAGRGEWRPFRRQARRLGITGRVRFLSERPDPERLYAAADLLVLPTRYDPFSNACLEAMAAGLPVATTPENGASELIEHGVNGFVLRDDFPAAFAALRDPEQLLSMGRAARKTAESHSWARHAEQVLELYERVRAG